MPQTLLSQKLEFRSATADNIEEIRLLCDIGIKNTLHCYGSMRRWYSESSKIHAIVIGYVPHYKDPIGAAIVMKSPEHTYPFDVNFGVAVKPSFQRMGVGTCLVRAIRDISDIEILPWKVEQHRIDFFNKALAVPANFEECVV